MTIEKFEDLLRVSEPWESWLIYSTWLALIRCKYKTAKN